MKIRLVIYKWTTIALKLDKNNNRYLMLNIIKIYILLN